jgi:predicted XRE-type DNA-binding protein
MTMAGGLKSGIIEIIIMPMMVLSDETFESEINKFTKDKIVKIIEEVKEFKIITSDELIGKVVDIKRGRSIGALEIPNSIRSLVAEEAINGTKAEIISEQFGISKSSISAYKNDATSTASYDEVNTELKKSNDLVRDSR